MGCCAKMKNVLLGLIKSSELHFTSSLTPPPHPLQIPFQKNPLHPLGEHWSAHRQTANWHWANMFGFSLPAHGISSPCRDGRLKSFLSHFATLRKGLKKRPILLWVTFRSGRRGKLRVNHLSWCHASYIRGIKTPQLNYDSFISATWWKGAIAAFDPPQKRDAHDGGHVAFFFFFLGTADRQRDGWEQSSLDNALWGWG